MGKKRDPGPKTSAAATSRSLAEPLRYGRWRAASLLLIHILIVAHFVHWKMRGRTLAPLELNEVMYTLEVGIVTAGFLFMLTAATATAVFGRFFCSWGCHMLALQDLSRWLLSKLGIPRPRPVRSRVLLLVPPITAAYMLFWPQIVRLVEGRPLPTLHLRTDAEGWASFVTNDFWRNLPGPWIAVLTFGLCGFGIVYLLGSRGFCTYACPYGAVFSVLDRLAPGRIRVAEGCTQCAICTAACSSGIRVHEEVDRHGMVVNPACLKDLDCVLACPEDVLHYGWGKPSLWKSLSSGGRFANRYDFSAVEDLLMAITFVVVLATFRGLYGTVPFLLSLALGAMIAFVFVYGVRLVTRANVRLRSRTLKQHGRLSPTGWAFASFSVTLFVFVAHSAFIRYHEVSGLAGLEAGQVGSANSETEVRYRHLQAANRYGLFYDDRVEQALLQTSMRLDRALDSERWSRGILERHPLQADTRLQLAQSLVSLQRLEEARRQFETVVAQEETSFSQRAAGHLGVARLLVDGRQWKRATTHLKTAIELSQQPAEVHAELGGVLAELNRLPEARAELETALRLDPDFGEAHYNLGCIHFREGRLTEAATSFKEALRIRPKDGSTLNNLAIVLERIGRPDEALEILEQAIVVDPGNADAHFNLSRLYFAREEWERSEQLLLTAARLDERYRDLLPGN
ncbi:MAG: tetratricopeptide repeat protein [Thermoanaerobaculia bacterium]|nr:tetratricopeptide repeat protein [Thermoanaerobaculia bacterium]